MKTHEGMKEGHYRHLFLMALFSFLAMYALMYSMVASAGDVYNNVNQVYMAGLMTAPMVLLELFFMHSMFPNKGRNALIVAASLAAGVGCFAAIRRQAGVYDRQFMRSMIPHHSAAILMCEQASIETPEVKLLCGGIVSSQRAEIEQMRALLRGDRVTGRNR